MRITAQLIDAPADKHLWAKSYERDSKDVLALQDEVASAIAKEIEVQLTPNEQARLKSAPTVNPAAHDAYLKGRYFFSRPSDENLKKAIADFEEAVRLDPNFAPAGSRLSDALLWGWQQRKYHYFRRRHAEGKSRGRESSSARRQFRRSSHIACHI